MASKNRKTTMAKLNRETKLRERRFEKQARKEARKLAAAQGDEVQPEAGVLDDPEAGSLEGVEEREPGAEDGA